MTNVKGNISKSFSMVAFQKDCSLKVVKDLVDGVRHFIETCKLQKKVVLDFFMAFSSRSLKVEVIMSSLPMRF